MAVLSRDRPPRRDAIEESAGGGLFFPLFLMEPGRFLSQDTSRDEGCKHRKLLALSLFSAWINNLAHYRAKSEWLRSQGGATRASVNCAV